METPAAKRSRLEPQNTVIYYRARSHDSNTYEIIKEQSRIIQNQKAVIENQKAQIQHLEDQLKNSESSATETKIKNVLVPELPNEIWLEIMSYLSTYDVLRNMAQVSQRFHKLSQDPG